MKLFAQTLMAAALFASSHAWGEDYCDAYVSSPYGPISYGPYEVPNAPVYRREIIFGEKKPYVGPNIPVDPLHKGMYESGLYTQDQAKDMTNFAISDLLTNYGIDFSDANPNVSIDAETGVRTIPGLAIFFPVLYGADKGIHLISDSADYYRAYDKWYVFQFGNLVQFSSSGTVSGGLFSGASYEVDDLYFFGDLNLLKDNADSALPPNREVINLRTSVLSKQIENQWGIMHSIITRDAIDQDKKLGFYYDTTSVLKDPTKANKNVYHSRPVITWDCPNRVIYP